MRRFHYGWVIAGVGVLVKMTGLGFGRFAYSMVVPSMRESLQLQYVQMGLLSGGILLGYLLFSFIGGSLATRFGSKRVVIASLFCSCLSMLGFSQFSTFLLLLPFSFGMGAAAAGCHIAMTTLPMAWFRKESLGKALGVVTGGTGFGVIVTGLLVPPVLLAFGKEGWRECWILMALITLSVGIAGVFLLKEEPDRSHLESILVTQDKTGFVPVKQENLSLRLIFIIYFIFGYAYNIYATYFVAFMVEDLRTTERLAGMIWSLFGWTSIGSGLIWGFLSDRMGRRKAFLWNNGLIALAVLLPLCFHQSLALGLSTFLFGLTFLGTVTIVAAAVGDQVVEKRASMYGLVTLVHGVGQFLGTTSGGYFKDLTGSFRLTLLLSFTGFLLCFVLAVLGRGRRD